MSNDNMCQRIYQAFDPSGGYPASSHLFYECLRCGEVVPSLPKDSLNCTCWNICIDVDYGRIAVEDHSKVKVFTCQETNVRNTPS